MNATLSLQRLVWKEYRALRQLWAMCGFGGTFLMLVILTIGESSSHMAGYSAAFWAFTVWVPPVYVLAALSTMFAGEREEGTLVWLTALSPRLPTVFISRVLFVVVSGLALQAWYAVVALALSQFDDSGSMYVQSTDIDENLRIMSFVLLESVAYGLFWSLQTRRPLNAILYAAIMLIMVNSGAAIIVDWLGGRYSVIPDDSLDYAFSFWGWVRCLFLVAVMAGNWRLAEGWLHGHPWDWEWVAQWWSQRRIKAASATHVATFPREASEPWRRAWQRLRWLEWQSIKSYAWVTLLFCGASWASILVKFENQHPTFAFSMIFCWLALLVAGAMAWHGEQTQQRFRALVRLGMSPLALWANKLLCGMLAATVSFTAIAGTTAVLWTTFARMSSHNFYADIQNMAWRQARDLLANGALAYFVLAAVTMFVSAFVSAHLVRRTVIAIGLALMGTGCTLAWLVICCQNLLPVSLFFAPIPVWLLWISVSALPGWWIEQPWRQISFRRGVEISLQAVAPLALLTLAAGYVVWEIPSVTVIDPGMDTTYHASINAQRKGNVGGTAQGWSNLRELLSEPLIVPPDIHIPEDKTDGVYRQPQYLVKWGESPAQARRSLVEANRKTIENLVGQIHAIDALLVTSTFDDHSQWSHIYGPLVMYASQIALEDGRKEASVWYLQAAARFTGMLQRFRLQYALPSHLVMTEMLRWAEHPAQTEQTLSLGLQLCSGELRYWQPQMEELFLQREVERKEANDHYWPWDRARARKLVDVAYSNRVLYLRGCEQQRLRPGLSAQSTSLMAPWSSGVSPGDPAFAAWKYQPPEYRYLSSDPRVNFAYGFERNFGAIVHLGENQYRALLARMAILGYRRLHDQWPSSLFSVEHYFGGQSSAMQDVWTRSHFGYTPEGFPLKEPEFPADCVFRQPLIWTAGPYHFTLELAQNRIVRRTNAYGFFANMDVRSSDDDANPDWVFPIRPRALQEQ